MRKLTVLVLLLFRLFPCAAQHNNIWYFGARAGLSFTPGGPWPIPYPVFNNAMVATEGCSSICDVNGNMLFYSNGHFVYNRNNLIMQNGNDLMGHESAFESVLVVPLPNSNHIYYVFTTDALENGFSNGYRYSIVDMNLDNGNGAVTTKNVLLHAPGTERLAAARHANGIDIWIITNDNNSNVFRAWLLSCNGLQPAPTVSTTGMIMDQFGNANIGAIKISPDGSLLCQTHFPDTNDQVTENFFQLFDFNNATGVISNPRTISEPLCRYYACEFAPDSKLLYLTKADGGEIDQFECTLGSEAMIIASQYTISAGQSFCGLQLGPDGKIYLCYFNSSLSVISKPDIKGPGCTFELNKVDLGGQFASLNLPLYLNDLSVNVHNGFNYRVIDTCAGIVQFTAFTNLGGTIGWSWDFGDAVSSTIQNPVHDFPSIYQLYTVKLTITSSTDCGYIERSKTIAPAGYLRRIDFQMTNVCDSGYARFENRSTFFPENPGQYHWDFGDGSFSNAMDPVHSYQQAGIYVVKLKINTTAYCLSDSLSKPLDFQVLDIQAPPDQAINEGQSVQLNVTGGGSVFSWNPPAFLSDPRISNPVATPPDDILYIVTVTSDAGCRDMDSVLIKVKLRSDIFIPSAFTPNNDGKNDIYKPVISNQFTLAYFSIYNRWGQRVFITTEPEKGWDGKLNGELQNQDVYVWVIRVIDRMKNVTEKKGTVVLIR